MRMKRGARLNCGVAGPWMSVVQAFLWDARLLVEQVGPGLHGVWSGYAQKKVGAGGN